MIYYTLASVAGFFAGIAGALVWRRILPSGYNRTFWHAFFRELTEVVRVDEPDEFITAYKQLLRQISKYLGRSLLALVLMVLPTIVIFYGVYLPLSGHWARSAEQLEIVISAPAASGRVDADGGIDAALIKESRWPWKGENDVVLQIDGKSIALGDAAFPHAFCKNNPDCYLYTLFGFESAALPDGMRHINMLVVRPNIGRANPLWPFLSDLDLFFFTALLLGMAGLFLAGRTVKNGNR